MDPQLALELQKLETKAWKNEALRNREDLVQAYRVIGVYRAWMARYTAWRRQQRDKS